MMLSSLSRQASLFFPKDLSGLLCRTRSGPAYFFSVSPRRSNTMA